MTAVTAPPTTATTRATTPKARTNHNAPPEGHLGDA